VAVVPDGGADLLPAPGALEAEPAKKAEAALRISFARRSSAFSALSRLISVASSEVTPGRRPASTSALRTHVRTVSASPMPSLAATAFIAAHSVG
jgi:hypothetical protein